MKYATILLAALLALPAVAEPTMTVTAPDAAAFCGTEAAVYTEWTPETLADANLRLLFGTADMVVGPMPRASVCDADATKKDCEDACSAACSMLGSGSEIDTDTVDFQQSVSCSCECKRDKRKVTLRCVSSIRDATD